jgi:hypothetical protein
VSPSCNTRRCSSTAVTNLWAEAITVERSERLGGSSISILARTASSAGLYLPRLWRSSLNPPQSRRGGKRRFRPIQSKQADAEAAKRIRLIPGRSVIGHGLAAQSAASKKACCSAGPLFSRCIRFRRNGKPRIVTRRQTTCNSGMRLEAYRPRVHRIRP